MSHHVNSCCCCRCVLPPLHQHFVWNFSYIPDHIFRCCWIPAGSLCNSQWKWKECPYQNWTTFGICLLHWYTIETFNFLAIIQKNSFSVLKGLGLGPLLDMVIGINPAIISTAFLSTTLIFSCFSLCALMSPRGQFVYLWQHYYTEDFQKQSWDRLSFAYLPNLFRRFIDLIVIFQILAVIPSL